MLLFILCLPFYDSKAQIKGNIHTSSGVAISNATIILKNQKGVILAYAISKENGSFTISYKIKDSITFILEAKHINFETQQKEITLKNNIVNFVLLPAIRQLTDVIIKTKLPPISVKSDTLEFKASSFMSTETVKVQDLLKNLPGIKVDAEGNITYNGQKVEKILLDGDDLTGTSYKLISKNLAANLIDTIQVIKNFNENRLLKSVAKSERVGINLKVNPGARGKLSGTGGIGESFNERRDLDINSIYLKQKVKLFGLINFNTVSNNTASDIDYYYDPFSLDKNYSILKNENSVITTGTIIMPSIGKKYTYDNSDLTSALMFNNTFKKTVKLKGAVGFNQQVNSNTSNGYSKTELDANIKWEIQNLENIYQRGYQWYGALNLTNDNLKRTIQELNINFNSTSNRNNYMNTTALAVYDTLTEKLRNTSSNFQAAYTATAKLSPYKVASINASFAETHLNQNFNSATERLAAFFNLPADYKMNDQIVATNKLLAELSSMVNGKVKNNHYAYGFKLNHRSISTNNNTTFRSMSFPPKYLPRNQTSFNLSEFQLRGSYLAQNGKNSISIGSSAGISKAMLSSTFGIEKNLASMQSTVVFSRRFTNLKAFSASYQFKISPPDIHVFYPINLISGNASILHGASDIKSERKHTAVLSFSSSNFFNFLTYYANITFSHQDLNYGQNLVLNSSYTAFYQAPQKNSSLLSINSSIEKYVAQLKSKFTLQFASTITKGYSIINDYASKNNIINLETSVKWNSAFNFPVNIEAQFNPQYFTNKTFINNNTYKNHMTSLQSYGKLKIALNKKLYASLLYNGFKLDPQSSFNTMDAYFHYKYTEKVSLSLTGHNLTNNTTVTQKNLSATSVSFINYNVVPAYILFKMSVSF